MKRNSDHHRHTAWLSRWQNRQRIAAIASAIAREGGHQPAPGTHYPDGKATAPSERVVIFNPSARLTGLTLNAAFGLLTSWALRLAGASVRQFACQAGMSRCVLGTQSADLDRLPPCPDCIAQTRRLYAHSNVAWFAFQEDQHLAATLENKTVAELSTFEFPARFLPQEYWAWSEPSSCLAGQPPIMPLGKLVITSVRWALRRHNLLDDEPTRRLIRQYILSAYSLAGEFSTFLVQEKPTRVVVFNGILYPEAAVRWVTRQIGVVNVAYEVGFQPYTVFFTSGEPTAYPIAIPDDFELSPEQDALLDAHLEKRFQGKFTMAGIQFWREIHGLDETLIQKAAGFRQIVPVFTNVVYDTSQAHSNTIFSNMFEWLEVVAEVIARHPETLFVIRAHPDEKRPNSKKISNESVDGWLHTRLVSGTPVIDLPNVVFIPPDQFLSSYELIQRSKFVMVYNSSIGLEAVILGAAVICGGKARYTQYPTVFLPESAKDLVELTDTFLAAEHIQAPVEFRKNARRFLYYQFFRVSIPVGEYITEGNRPGFVHLKSFPWQQLKPENSPALDLIVKGILEGAPFLLPETHDQSGHL